MRIKTITYVTTTMHFAAVDLLRIIWDLNETKPLVSYDWKPYSVSFALNRVMLSSSFFSAVQRWIDRNDCDLQYSIQINELGLFSLSLFYSEYSHDFKIKK